MIDNPYENGFKIFIDGKGVSECQQTLKKNQIEEMRSQVQKYEKYKSKNDIKNPLGPFNKDLRAISVFFSCYLVKL